MSLQQLPLLLSAIIVGMASAVGYNYIYLPNQGRVSAIQAKIEEERVTQQSQLEVGALLDEYDGYRKRLPKAPDTSWLVQQAVTLSEQAGIQLEAITQGNPQPSPPFTLITITLEFSASYHELGTFIDLIERAPHFLQVERLDIGLQQQDTGQGKPVMKMDLGTLSIQRSPLSQAGGGV